MISYIDTDHKSYIIPYSRLIDYKKKINLTRTCTFQVGGARLIALHIIYHDDGAGWLLGYLPFYPCLLGCLFTFLSPTKLSSPIIFIIIMRKKATSILPLEMQNSYALPFSAENLSGPRTKKVKSNRDQFK